MDLMAWQCGISRKLIFMVNPWNIFRLHSICGTISNLPQISRTGSLPKRLAPAIETLD
jgi:hypothetical protein